MKLTLSWLKDHLDTDAPLDEIVETLTRIGLEVEGLDDPAKKLKDFVIAHVIEANQPMFIAGCRCFTLTEAIEHWGRINPNPPYIKAISDYMETRKST